MALAAEKAYERVRSSILDGTYSPAERLGEVELAAALGISRTPIREALRRLETEGLVEVLPHRGARVAQWSPRDVEEIYDLRMLLESFMAATAAGRITAAQLDRLTELSRLMEAAAAPGPEQDLDRIAELNSEFHAVIAVAAGSPRLTAMLNTLVQLPLVLRTFHRYSRADLLRSLGHHRELIDALRAGDPRWAESVMRSHVLAARMVLLRSQSEPAPIGA